MLKSHRSPRLAAVSPLALLGFAAIWTPTIGHAQITEIINEDGDGLGNQLIGASSVAVDGSGTVFVSGFGSDNVFKITPPGIITEIMDTNGFGSGNFLCDARDIALDAAGNVFVTGYVSDNVFKITPAGVVTEIINFSGDGAGHFLDGAESMAVDGAGNVYVAAYESNNAFKITPAGVITQIIDILAGGGGNFLNGPRGIAVDAADNVYVTGEFSRNAFKITPAGVITEIIDFSGDGAGHFLERPQGIAVDATGTVYVACLVSHNAFKVTPGGAITEIIDATGDGSGVNPFDQGTDVAVSNAGNVYVAARQSNNVFQISPTGVVTEIIDSSGAPGSSNNLDNPVGLAVDGSGDVFVAGGTRAFHVDLPAEFRTLCNGDGGDQLGCTDCPCANNAPQGTLGGCLNSVSKSARLTATGDPSFSLPVSSIADLRFALDGAPPTTFCILTSGDAVAPTNMMNACFGLESGIQSTQFDGLRCAVSNTQRHGVRSSDIDGNVGIVGVPWGGEGLPLFGIAQESGFLPGQTRYFQVIHREDVMLSCMNASEAGPSRPICTESRTWVRL